MAIVGIGLDIKASRLIRWDHMWSRENIPPMDPIFVSPRYPNDPLPDAMADFANAVAAEAGGRGVLCQAEEPEAPQVSLHELFYVWLPATMSAVEAGKVVAVMGKWLLKRHAEARVKRTRTIVLYDPNGNEVRSISVKRDDNILTEGGAEPFGPRRLPPIKK